MTDLPYTDDDLRAEAGRQHANLTEDPDYMGVGESMEDQEVTPGGGVAWGDFSDETYEAAQRSIHQLVSDAANLSEWAVHLGADGLMPVADCLSLKGDDRSIVRVHFAFDPDMPEEMRHAFIEGLGQEIADYL